MLKEKFVMISLKALVNTPAHNIKILYSILFNFDFLGKKYDHFLKLSIQYTYISMSETDYWGRYWAVSWLSFSVIFVSDLQFSIDRLLLVTHRVVGSTLSETTVWWLQTKR